MDHYIVRVYRFRKKDPRRLVGTVEHVGAQGKMAFTNYDELWDIITSRKWLHLPKVRRERQRGKVGREKSVEK